MKKTLLAGVLAASLAISSSAFAAVGEDASLQVTYDPDTVTVSVDTDLSGAGQRTVIVLDTDGAIVADNILYIDQAEAGAEIFKGMGLLLKDEATKLDDGTYYVKVGNDQSADILVGTFTVSSEAGFTEVKFVYGDVNGVYVEGANALSMVTATDALAILGLATGGSTAKGGSFNLGDVITTKDGTKIVYGDVNGVYVEGANALAMVTATDALAILGLATGGSTAKGGSFNLGDVVTAIVPNN